MGRIDSIKRREKGGTNTHLDPKFICELNLLLLFLRLQVPIEAGYDIAVHLLTHPL